MNDQPTFEQRIDAMTDEGLKFARDIQDKTPGPKDAIGLLSIVVGRVLCEFPTVDERMVALLELMELSLRMQKIIEPILVRE